jgi:SRSO17 transposase
LGLIQAERKNMERMEEGVPEVNEQALHHMLSESAWADQAILEQVAREADRHLGGQAESCLIIDESGFPKKGQCSVGVARQWCGQLGKVENCQVGVFAALGCGAQATLIAERLFLPESWTADPERCRAASVPTDELEFKRKHDLALELVAQARSQRLGYAWVGFDGLYGEDPAFLRTLADRGEIFVGDVHKDQRLYLKDPKPIVPPPTSPRGRQPSRLQAQTSSIRVDQWAQQQPSEAWQRITLRESTKGALQVDVLHRRVWLWDGKETEAREWHVLVRREVDTPTQLKYSLSNVPADTPTSRLAFMQGQRYWIERALQNAKQDLGLGDYQGRGWRGWHHHMALVMMAMLFMLEERLLHQETRPLLSGTDIRALLNHFLPRRDTTFEEVLRQMELRHRKRQAGIDSANRKQRLSNIVEPDG